MVVCYRIGNSKHVHISDFKQGLRSFLNRLRFIFNTANIFVFMKICLFNFSTNFNVHDHELSKLHDCTLWWHLTIAKSWLGNNNFEILYQSQFCFRYFGSFKWIFLSCKPHVFVALLMKKWNDDWWLAFYSTISPWIPTVIEVTLLKGGD